LKKILAIHESKLSANLSEASENDVTPPTFIQTNDFTWAFQEIVNTYGVPRYREINPALFNIVTFPFLFGVMFGDIGHGFLLFLFAGYLCWGKDEFKGDHPLRPALKARYLLLMMGFFAIFNGWMYNDFLSIPLGIFGTCYKNVGEIAERKTNDCVYPFGLDPKWYVASNELAFFNSLKMKTSVILGVSHMLFGIILRGINAVYFRSKVDIFFDFIPQFIFMTILFGYMIVMIFVKWTINWYDWLTPDKDMFIQAPSIITQLMNIFLKGGDVGKTPLWGEGDTQREFHFIVFCKF
jgi:V-type H+-transporting ATPase subunit a